MTTRQETSAVSVHERADASAARSIGGLIRRHPVASFFTLAYLISWSWWVPLALQGDVVRAGQGWPTHLPGLIGPALAAAVVTGTTEGRAGLRDLGRRMLRWRIGVRWWLVVAATFALAGLGAVQALLTGGEVPTLGDFTRYTGVASVTPLLVVAVVLVLNGLGEETGWRGFAVDRLLHDHDLRWTALVVGLGWAGWHLPFFWLVDTFRSFGPLAAGWFISMVAASLVLARMYVAGHRSILLVAAWHTAFNFTSATEATGALIGTVMSVAVISWAVWTLRQPDCPTTRPTSPPRPVSSDVLGEAASEHSATASRAGAATPREEGL